MFDDWIVFLIPLFSAFIGWGTNVVAVQMMFYPIEFFGFRPFLGWQGIVPANARELAERSTDLITTKLINLKQVFQDFDAEAFAGENMQAALDDLTEQVIQETADKHAGAMWANAPDMIKDQVRAMVRAEIQKVSVEILSDIGQEIEELLDLKEIVVEAAMRDRKLIGNMFQTTGAPEFRFIKNSGAYFGFLFGVVQMFAWVIYPAWWVLPFFGFFVGYATNWLALKLIFEPQEPMTVGPFTFQGLFHKRQAEVSKEFAQIVSKDIINPDTMVAKMISGKRGDRLYAIVEQHMGGMIDRYSKHPIASGMVPADRWDDVRGELSGRVREELPKPGGFLHIFTSRAINVYGELFDRMTDLDAESFEGVLRPAFQKDEWKLILAGAALGLGAGTLQVVYLFGGQLS